MQKWEWGEPMAYGVIAVIAAVCAVALARVDLFVGGEAYEDDRNAHASGAAGGVPGLCRSAARDVKSHESCGLCPVRGQADVPQIRRHVLTRDGGGKHRAMFET